MNEIVKNKVNKLETAHRIRKQNKHEILEIIWRELQKGFVTPYELAKKMDLTSRAIAEHLNMLCRDGKTVMLQIVYLGRLRKVYYIPEKNVDDQLVLPPELVAELAWQEGQELFFVAQTAFYFVIQETINEKDQFAVSIYKTVLETTTDNKNQIIRLPYNWILFYQLDQQNLDYFNRFTVAYDTHELIYAVDSNERKRVLPVQPLN